MIDEDEFDWLAWLEAGERAMRDSMEGDEDDDES